MTDAVKIEPVGYLEPRDLIEMSLGNVGLLSKTTEHCNDPIPLYDHRAMDRIKELEVALKPFADELDLWDGWTDEDILVEPFDKTSFNLTVGHLRAARRALTGGQKDG